MTPPNSPLRAGDFSTLADDYARYRPGYAPAIVTRIASLVGKPFPEIEAADVGAGTGIWSRQLASVTNQVIAVEPNAAMRRRGQETSAGLRVDFREGRGEATGLATCSVDLVTMASSFHWVDFENGLAEFARILRPNGRFVALWNPRVVDANPLFRRIEDHITTLKPNLTRVSSGTTAFTETLTERLGRHKDFDDVVYIEDFHVEQQSRERYLGLWNSVNDVRVQLGPELWAKFMDFVAEATAGHDGFDVTYRTRAWAARRRA